LPETNQLVAEGKPVTANSLLEALGGGSFTTIYKHLAAWQLERPAPTSTISGEIPATVQNAFASTWKVAAQEAAREVEAAKAKAAEEVQVAQDQFAGALLAIEKLERENEEGEEQIEALKKEIAVLQQDSGKLESANAALKAADEEIRRQLDGQNSELDRLRKEIEKSRDERDNAMKEAAELKGSVATLQSQNTELLKSLTGKK
jgi:chromosome segregation ATPase